MLSTIALVVAGLSTGHKIGLVAVAAAFIVFALVSSFVIPRRNPNFPGKAMPVYVTVAVLFFVAMMAAVLVFGKESEASGSGAPAAQTSTQSSPAPAPGTTTATTTAAAPTTTAAPGGGTQGDPVAGKKVFTSASCAGCHTLKDAGATGTVGPNLDQLKPAEAVVVRQVTNGGKIMPAFKGQLSTTQIQDVAAYVFKATHS